MMMICIPQLGYFAASNIAKATGSIETLLMVQKSGNHQLIWRIYHYVQGFIHAVVQTFFHQQQESIKHLQF